MTGVTAGPLQGGNASFAYDGLGRRVQAVAGGFTSRFFYGQAGRSLYTLEGKTGQFHAQVYLSGSLVARHSVPQGGGAAAVSYQHTDALGSPVAQTDASGAVVRRERMTAYGEPADGTWADGPGFTGHEMDAVSGLVYMQQRYYDPVVGRFLSVDPVAADLVAGDAFNRFRYALNSPLRFVDPDGRKDTELPPELVRQNYESIGDGKVVRVDKFDVDGEARFEVHIYKDSTAFRKAAAEADRGVLRKRHEINTLDHNGSWGKHGKPTTAPDLGTEGQKGFERVVKRELHKRGLDSPRQLKLRGFGRFMRFLGPAAAVAGYLGDNSVNAVCSQGDPGGGVCD